MIRGGSVNVLMKIWRFGLDVKGDLRFELTAHIRVEMFIYRDMRILFN